MHKIGLTESLYHRVDIFNAKSGGKEKIDKGLVVKSLVMGMQRSQMRGKRTDIGVCMG